MSIIRLSASHAFLYSQMRLDALKSAPQSFDHEYEVECKKSVRVFKEDLTRHEVYGAFVDEILQGIGGFTIRPEKKHSHKGRVWGMWVAPEHRGCGVSRMILDHIIVMARGRIEIIHLVVDETNHVARRLYAGLGFLPYAMEPRAVKIDGEYSNDIWMSLDFNYGVNG